jgi:hypothetical protein
MASDTLTLKLQGDVSLADFAKAIARFNALVNGLTETVAPDANIDWSVADLQTGSATATTLGIAKTDEPLLLVRRAYLSVGQALESDTPVAYGRSVREAAVGIRAILNGRVTEAIFETADSEAVVRAAAAQPTVIRPAIQNKGAVTGRIQTLLSRGGLRFTLYDLLHDKAVSCYLEEGKEDLLRDAWGRLAIVEGLVRRDPITGRPMAIRHVSTIHVPPDQAPDAYQAARGAVPLPPGSQMPEDVIRRLRDA